MPKQRKTQEPENLREALAWIKRYIRAGLEEYNAHKPPLPVTGMLYVQWLSDVRRLRWCAEILETAENKKDLEQLFGLKAGRGRPLVQDRRDKILEKLLKIVLLLEPRGPTRQGKPARPSWKEIGPACGMTAQAAKRLFERELPNLPEALAKEIAARMKQKPPPIGKAKVSAALGKEIAAQNRRAAKARRRSQNKKPAR